MGKIRHATYMQYYTCIYILFNVIHVSREQVVKYIWTTVYMYMYAAFYPISMYVITFPPIKNVIRDLTAHLRIIFYEQMS